MKPPSEDGCAVLLLCSDLMSRGADGEAKAYTVRQWANLSERLSGSDLAPRALFHVELKEIREKLGLADSEASRIEALLSRAGKLGVELAALRDKGISTVTSWDDGYPKILKTRLGKFAPPVLYYAGDLFLLSSRGVAIVGSREIDDAILKFTDRLSLRCVAGGLSIVSGGARGVDSIAENAANRVEGNAIVVVADSLEKKIRQKDTRDAILRKKALILSAFRPDMPFQAFAAMERNKYIYALANYAVVVSSSYNKGGTWAGATENLKHGWVPMFVRSAEPVAEGNRRLLAEKGVRPITAEVLNDEAVNMAEWFASNVEAGTGAPKPGGRDEECRQQSLFDMLP
jgi:predicted Rossmann fold nucleotide-binding protein DprA/Smf involved in DNA uptake